MTNDTFNLNKILLTHESHVILQGKWTPLHAAARFGHAEVVETLVKSGANAGAAVIVSSCVKAVN